jgi:hypothetical protein
MIEKTQFKGFDAVKLTNGKGDELIVLTEIGPRIISYKPEGKDNFFYENEMDLQKEKIDPIKWHVFGGTRLWVSPESSLTYAPDNKPVKTRIKENRATFISETDDTNQIKKIIEIEAKEHSFSINFTVKNEGSLLVSAGLWALSCLKPAGDAIIYLPWGEESNWNVKDMKYWRSWLSSGSDVESAQWIPTNEFFIVKPTGETGKVGFANRHGFVLFRTGDLSFIKRAGYIESAAYPDDGCSFEIYTSSAFYEIESLSPLYCLKPGIVYTHTEDWWAGFEPVDTDSINGVKSFINRLF